MRPVPAVQTRDRFKAQTLYSYGAPYQIRDTTGATAKTLWTLTAANDYGSATGEKLGTAPTTTSVTNLSVGYDANGNITSKLGVGTYAYGDPNRPHAVTAAGSHTFAYDANGNVVTRNGLAQTWASFNLPTSLQATVNGSPWQSQLWYGPDFQRWKQVATYVNGTETFHYVGGLLEKKHSTSTGVTYWQHHVYAPSGQAIIVSRNSNGTSSTTFALSDHLGSADALLNLDGSLKARLSFSAFGERRGSSWSGTPSTADWAAIADTTRHGFTWHEHLDNVNLIHMNGRVYDPVVGRFLSVDPLIGDIADSQQVNPYAYVGNRPLSYTDPTGLSPDPVTACAWVCKSIVASIGATLRSLFGSDKPPPPPATALPGISAQNGMMICGPGGSSAACSGMILYMGPGGLPPLGSGPGRRPGGNGSASPDGAGFEDPNWAVKLLFRDLAVNAANELFLDMVGEVGAAVDAAQEDEYGAAVVLIGGVICDGTKICKGLGRAAEYAGEGIKRAARAGSKIPVPSLKSSPFGPKIGDAIPTNGVPRNWSRDQIRDAISDYRTSIASRRAELAAFDALGGGSATQRLAHTQRITAEESFLKSLEKALGR